MPLPQYNSRITLEEALEQFDYATSELVLHPFNGAGNDVDARREHVFKAAQNTYLTASRWYGVIEGNKKRGSSHNLSRRVATRYVNDINACTKVLTEKVLLWYSRVEEQERKELGCIKKTTESEKYKAKQEKVKSIKREKALIESYITLMKMMSGFVGEVLK